MNIEPGDMVLIAVGKKQFSRHGIPLHLRKETLEVVEVEEGDVTQHTDHVNNLLTRSISALY